MFSKYTKRLQIRHLNDIENTFIVMNNCKTFFSILTPKHLDFYKKLKRYMILYWLASIFVCMLRAMQACAF